MPRLAPRLTLTVPIVEPTRSSNDLKAFELLTSPSFLARLPPSPPNSDVVFSVTPDSASDVFWYLLISSGINKLSVSCSDIQRTFDLQVATARRGRQEVRCNRKQSGEGNEKKREENERENERKLVAKERIKNQ